MEQVALSYIVLYIVLYPTVKQHVPEMMYDLSPIPCVIPTACLWEKRISNQRAHQGSKPNEEMKSLQNVEDKGQSRDILSFFRETDRTCLNHNNICKLKILCAFFNKITMPLDDLPIIVG